MLTRARRAAVGVCVVLLVPRIMAAPPVHPRFEPGSPKSLRRRLQAERDRSESVQLMIYLNSGFDGGETHFYDADLQLRATVRPETGMALLFRHAQLHEGAPVISGRKYVLRTDVMYTLDLSGPTIDAAVL
jgi:hypothetical protein